MIRADQLQIGDYVLVSGTPRRVESITKKKIGYHINPQTDNRLHYARLHDVEPIEISEVFVEDTKNIILNRIFRVHGDMWACGNRNKVNIDFSEGDAGFYTPFFLHDFFHVVKAGVDKDAILSVKKTYEERQKDIDAVVKVVDGKIVGNIRLTELREYLIVHNLHAVVYLGDSLIFSTKDGSMDKENPYYLWEDSLIEITDQYTDWIEIFHIKIIADE
jgi:hypothetical protein